MIPEALKSFGRQLVRIKVVDSTSDETRLSRCLNTFDLVALGVGSTLGAGVYVVAGNVAKENSGPAIILSFLIAAVASILAGLCYAEFGARVPKTGSAYLYTYVTAGELLAFITGWNLLLSYAIGTSSVAKTWSITFDTLIGGKIEKWSKNNIPMNLPGVLSDHPDVLSVALVMILTGVLGFGVKESALVGKIFTSINILVLMSVMVGGMIKGDPKNWKVHPDNILSAANASSPNTTDHSSLKQSLGAGGFMPFGWTGVFSGAATCFYAFIGFECIATTGEEVKNPQKAIPIGIVSSLLICLVMYMGVSTALTVLMPYYLLDRQNPLPVAFTHVGWPRDRVCIDILVFAVSACSLLGAMFPMPRVMWAMAEDGLLFKCLSRINRRTQTPVIATVMSGVVAALMAMLFNLKELVDLMSIGALLAYTLVAACVLVLRYKPDKSATDETAAQQEEVETEGDGAIRRKDDFCATMRWLVFHPDKEPTPRSGFAVTICTSMLVVLAFLFSSVAVTGWKAAWRPILLGAIITACVGVTAVVWRQPQNKTKLTFKVPLVPLIPLVSMLINTYLMTQLLSGPWVHYTTCMAIGILVYFGYGIRNSALAEWNKVYECKLDGRGDEL
ncbi:high affinity cationic amino acid transporter 1-like [Hippocampus comes]|uniref:high affinity cationic amino acid transporter 1-like n=1 Tax=Hippocampus comes TaxID=109280 RepID=UPI00094F0CEE|nr:PREDICTED: high affinity cationic amino acid transporter 1-like [Hippocampus comes]